MARHKRRRSITPAPKRRELMNTGKIIDGMAAGSIH